MTTETGKLAGATAKAAPAVAYLTAGAAGMYCGSCMRDNTLAAALHDLGVNVQLLPLYTPIRTDEDNVSVDHIAFGGINVYLQQRVPLFRWLPAWLDGVFDRPWLINRMAGSGIETDASHLGDLTVSMLRGTHGYQRKEVKKLVRWLRRHIRPNLFNLSNMLIAGCVPALKESFSAPVLVTLQGDDIFLDDLPEPQKSQAFAEIRKLVRHVDAFLVFSRYYADFMGDYFGIPAEKLHIVPLGIDTRQFQAEPEPEDRPPTVGYLARLAPEKGLHRLVDAFLLLREHHGMEDARLRIAGWLGEKHKAYAQEQFHRLDSAGLAAAYEYVGEVDRAGKLAFLHSIDVLSVPTVYRDPKGLFVLEALAAGVPVVQPEHGAFTEVVDATQGGRLVRPGDAQHLADTLFEMLLDRDGCRATGRAARRTVHTRFDARSAAQATLGVYQSFLT